MQELQKYRPGHHAGNARYPNATRPESGDITHHLQPCAGRQPRQQSFQDQDQGQRSEQVLCHATAARLRCPGTQSWPER